MYLYMSETYPSRLDEPWLSVSNTGTQITYSRVDLFQFRCQMTISAIASCHVHQGRANKNRMFAISNILEKKILVCGWSDVEFAQIKRRVNGQRIKFS